MKNSPAIKYAIICDSVRREDNGKLIAVGIYAYNILVPEFPITLFLALMFATDMHEKTITNFELLAEINGKRLSGGKGKFDTYVSGEALTYLQPVPYTFTEEGDLTIKIKFDEGDWQLIKTIGVAKEPKATSTLT